MKTNENVGTPRTTLPATIKEMSRQQLEETIISEIRLKNTMQEFIIKENLLEDFDIWYSMK